MAKRQRQSGAPSCVIAIDPLAETPIFQQIHDSVVKSIASGDLRGDDLLPSVRYVAQDLRVNPATVKKAYDLLAAGGFTVTEPRSGTRVARTRRPSTSRDLEEKFSQVVRYARALQVSDEELHKIFTRVVSASTDTAK